MLELPASDPGMASDAGVDFRTCLKAHPRMWIQMRIGISFLLMQYGYVSSEQRSLQMKKPGVLDGPIS